MKLSTDSNLDVRFRVRQALRQFGHKDQDKMEEDEKELDPSPDVKTDRSDSSSTSAERTERAERSEELQRTLAALSRSRWLLSLHDESSDVDSDDPTERQDR